jgi:hypothetical protein
LYLEFSAPTRSAPPVFDFPAAERQAGGCCGLTAVCGLVSTVAIFYLAAMTREEIIRDIDGLDAELAALEDQYGLLSADFYHCFRAGELEQTRDFIRWVGYYEAKIEREAR